MLRSSFGPGIVIRAENFGAPPIEDDSPSDAFFLNQSSYESFSYRCLDGFLRSFEKASTDSLISMHRKGMSP